MRKNGVNRELIEIGGGLCAPNGFRASFGEQDGLEGLLLVCDSRYPTAVVLPNVSFLTADAAESKIRSKDGRAKVVFVERGMANLFQKDGLKTAKTLRKSLAAQFSCAETDALLFSVGEPSAGYSLQKVGALSDWLASSLSAEIPVEKSVAFTFYLGDFPIKIGAFLSRNTSLKSGFSESTLIVTTDVKISGEMLDKAFATAYRDTFGLAARAESPFDCAVAFSSQKAKNYTVMKADGEYEKFLDALTRVFASLAERFAVGEGERILEITLSGGRSKRSTRAAARAIAKRFAVEKSDFSKTVLSELFSALAVSEADVGGCKAQIGVLSEFGELILVEDGGVLPYNEAHFVRIFSAEKIFLNVDLREGNYSSITWARVCV